MIGYDDALAILRGIETSFPTETVPVSRAHRRVVGKGVTADIPNPAFTNSAMDGFAFRHDDVGADLSLPVAKETIYAQPMDSEPPAQPAAVRIMTGAPVPKWADTVIPVEKTDLRTQRVVFQGPLSRGANIRHQGEDISQGATILTAGTYLNPEALMLATNFGHQELTVRKQPKILIISTGDELRDPGEALRPGQIYNSSQHFLSAAVRSYGLTPSLVTTIRDDGDLLQRTLDEHLQDHVPTLILTTGAVSAGEKDFIPRAGRSIGFETLFHKVAVRPGKPLYAAKQNDVIWLGLPGNPISTATSWHFFVRPFLAAWAGYPQLPLCRFRLRNGIKKPEKLRCFFRGRADSDGGVELHSKQGSAHLLASMSANAYIILFEGNSEMVPDMVVDGLRV